MSGLAINTRLKLMVSNQTLVYFSASYAVWWC